MRTGCPPHPGAALQWGWGTPYREAMLPSGFGSMSLPEKGRLSVLPANPTGVHFLRIYFRIYFALYSGIRLLIQVTRVYEFKHLRIFF